MSDNESICSPKRQIGGHSLPTIQTVSTMAQNTPMAALVKPSVHGQKLTVA
jgi:hypothetical protein